MRRPPVATVAALARACHLEPTLAVTVATGLLAVRDGSGPGTAVLVVGAVFTGQLTIGWSNDLLDASRDRATGRGDKPLVGGGVGPQAVRWAVAVALPVCVVLSLLCGWRSGLTHLVLGVGSGWAYNLWLKGTVVSWLPYALAFGALPAVVSFAAHPDRSPEPWLLAAGALLGVGAHLANTVPDLAEDAATGIRGLPHRLGGTWSARLAGALMVAASCVTAWGPGFPPTWCLAVVAAVAALVAVGMSRAKTAFHAAVLAGVADVVMVALR